MTTLLTDLRNNTALSSTWGLMPNVAIGFGTAQRQPR